MKIELREHAFDPWLEMQVYQNQESEFNGKFGATSLFIGTMRDFNQNREIQSMVLEHYPEMTQKHLHKIAQEAIKQWDIFDVLMIHRFGNIKCADTIVLLATWSAHRDAAFSACRYLIEELKTRAPFWKNETLLADNSTRWVTQS